MRGVRTAAPLTPAEQAGQPGSSPGVTTQAGRGGVEVSATGAMAQGLEVEQTGPGGLVTAQCSAPGTSFWFVGPGQASAGTIELYLMNTGSEPADAQVSVLTDVTKGPPLLGNADNGITVPPHGMVVQSLGHLLQSSKVVALNVTTSVGQVVAAVRESRSARDDGNWLPATQAPARHLVIPGLPGDSGSRDLYIAVPGSASAQVKVTAVTAKGSYQPTGGTGIDLLGGSAVSIPLPSLSGVPGAIIDLVQRAGGRDDARCRAARPARPVRSQSAPGRSWSRACSPTTRPARPARPTWCCRRRGKAASVRITTATSTVSATGQQGTVVQIKAGSSVVLPSSRQPGTRATAFSLIVTPLAARARSTRAGSSPLADRPVDPAGAQLADLDTAAGRSRTRCRRSWARRASRPPESGYSSAG